MDLRVCELADLIGVQDCASYRAAGIERVHLLAPAGRYSREPPALVLGPLVPHAEIYRQFVRTTEQSAPAVHLTALHDAIVLNQGAVITADGHLLRESCDPFIRDRVPMFGLERRDDGAFRRTAPVTRRVEEPALLTKGAWWRNYGHWLVDEAAALALVRQRSSLPLDTQIVIGAYDVPQMKRVVADTVSSVNPRWRILEHPDEECWEFATLYYVSPVHIPPLFKSPDALFALRALLMPLGTTTTLKGRFYLQRPSIGRVVVNEDEVMGLCRSYGLEVIRPETLALHDQIALFQSAELIVGVKGAAFTNLLFCGHGASAILLSPADFSDAFYWDIAARLGIAYMEVFGPLASETERTAQNPFTIDLSHLDHALRKALEARSHTATPVKTPLHIWGDRTRSESTHYDAYITMPAPDKQRPSGNRNTVMPALASLPDLKGANYLDVLKFLFGTLRPLSYVDIGTLTGDSLRLVECASIAIDTKFQLEGDIVGSKPSCHLYQMPSDKFFDLYDPTAILGRRIDAALIDGMHLCEFALRDFVNLERHAQRNSVVFFHDCVPLEFLICGRVHGQESIDPKRRGWWQGDVWRTILALKKRRPDLRITVLDAQPTGLACITNLDPSSTVLSTDYAEIVDEMHAWDLEEIGLLEYQGIVGMKSTSVLMTAEGVARHFWL